jgi:hypothetical protein
MNRDGVHEPRREKYFRKFEETSPILLLGMVLLTGGLFVLNWIYAKNKEFEEFFEDSPDSNRGLVIMMVFPFSWFFIMLGIKLLLFDKLPLALGILEIVVWGILIFLIYKYIYDFCDVFGQVTHSSTLLWFFFFVLSGMGILSLALKFYYVSPLVFFLAVVLPSMQTELNTNFKSLILRRKDNSYYK